MDHHRQFFINGHWVAPAKADLIEVIDPAHEEAFATIAAGSSIDVDRAIAAAKAAFPAYSLTGMALP